MTAATAPLVRDDNLRLIFAADEERFIHERQSISALKVRVCAPLAVVCWGLLVAGWGILPSGVILALVFVAPAMLATSLVAWRDVLRYRGYAADLRKFLGRYNRL